MQKNNGKVIVVLENAKKGGEIVMPHVCAFYQLVAIGEWWGFPKFYATDDLLNRKHTDQKRPLGREAASVSAHMTPRPSEVLKSRAGKRRDEIRLINARETILDQRINPTKKYFMVHGVRLPRLSWDYSPDCAYRAWLDRDVGCAHRCSCPASLQPPAGLSTNSPTPARQIS